MVVGISFLGLLLVLLLSVCSTQICVTASCELCITEGLWLGSIVACV